MDIRDGRGGRMMDEESREKKTGWGNKDGRGREGRRKRKERSE